MNGPQIPHYLRFAVGAFLLAAMATPASAAESVKVVVPNSLGPVEGDDLGVATNAGSFRQQQLYPASEFADLPEGRRAITGMYARADKTVVTPSSASYADLEILASTTSASQLSGVFSNNYGEAVKTVFEGPLTISTQAEGPPAGPRGFDYYFPFETPYLYDPDAGNLLVELSSDTGPDGDLVLDVYSSSTPIYVAELLAGASTGMTQRRGAVNQFEFSPVSSADFNLDFTVDDQDLAVWEAGYGGPGSFADGDATGDGLVTGADFLVWQRKYVGSVPGLAAELGVPEPGTLLLGCVGLALVGALAKRRSSNRRPSS